MKKTAFFMSLIIAASFTSCVDKSSTVDSSSPETALSATEESENTIPAEDQANSAIGTWIVNNSDNDYITELVIEGKNKAYIRMETDITDHFCFDKEHNFISAGKTVTKDEYDFYNGEFSFIYNDKLVLKMKKTDGTDDIFGEFVLIGGQYLDKVRTALNEDYEEGINIIEDKLTVIAEENKTSLSMLEEIDSFELKDDVMITDISGEGNLLESPYEVDGDKLTITNSEGEKNTYQRKKQ